MCKIKSLHVLYKNALSHHGGVHDPSHCLHLVHCVKDNERTCANAAQKGHYTCLVYAHQIGCCMTSLTIAYAAMHGHKDCIEYAHNNGARVYPSMLYYATTGGHLDCLKYMHDCLNNECIKMRRPRFSDSTFMHDKRVCENAAQNGHLPCIIFAHENGYPLSENACQCALFRGHFECFVYLYERVRPHYEFHDMMKIATYRMMGDEQAGELLFEKSSLRCMAYILREHAQGRIQKDTGMPTFSSYMEKEKWAAAMAYRRRVSIIENVYIMYKVRKRVESYKQELMAKTWHPTRFMNWCLDQDEKHEVIEDMGLCK